MTTKKPAAEREQLYARVPLAEEDKARLAAALKKVPSERVLRYEWESPGGNEFLAVVDEVRRRHVPVPWIAQALGISENALANLVTRKLRRAGRDR